MVHTAILFTGSYRTFEKCHRVILEHLIAPNEAKIFVLCEAEPHVKDRIVALVGERYVGEVVCRESTRTEEFKELCHYLAKTKPAIQKPIFDKIGWNQDYVFHSGSILEYYQFMKCFDLLVAYEKEHAVSFDVLVRSRLDIVIGRKLRLVDFFTHVHEELYASVSNDLYRRGLGDPVLCDTIQSSDYLISSFYDNALDPDFTVENSKKMVHHLNTASYLWVLGQNQVWIGKRHVFDKLYPLVFFYGDFRTSNPFTFNSETQFAEYCAFKNIQILGVLTKIDDFYIASRSGNQSLLVDGTLNPTIKRGFMWSILRTDGYPFPNP